MSCATPRAAGGVAHGFATPTTRERVASEHLLIAGNLPEVQHLIPSQIAARALAVALPCPNDRQAQQRSRHSVASSASSRRSSASTRCSSFHSAAPASGASVKPYTAGARSRCAPCGVAKPSSQREIEFSETPMRRAASRCVQPARPRAACSASPNEGSRHTRRGPSQPRRVCVEPTHCCTHPHYLQFPSPLRYMLPVTDRVRVTRPPGEAEGPVWRHGCR